MTFDRDTVLAALSPDGVLGHYQISGRWFGQWFRSRRCATADHGTDAFGMSREGKHHCHACGTGGDLLTFIALAEQMDPRGDFGRVLEVAARIGGVDPTAPPAPRRPAPPAGPTLAERLAIAVRRAAWLWTRRQARYRPGEMYLAHRGIAIAELLERGIEIGFGPLRILAEEVKSDDARKVRTIFWTPAIILPVTSIDGSMVDVRRRLIDPAWAAGVDPDWPRTWPVGEDTPRIMGMPGGLTRDRAELVGCYGRLDQVDGDRDIVVVEGAFDYLSAVLAWPEYDVLGAVDAAQVPLVAAHAAARAAEGETRVILLGQNDPPRMNKATGVLEDGASTKALDEARARILRRIPLDRAPMILPPAGFKDGNDLIKSNGLAALRRVLADVAA